jgi:hypothetical protein
MNETEIRTRLREAMGEAEYPPALTTRVAARVKQPPTSTHPGAIGFVAALLTVLIVASLVYVRVQSGRSPGPAVTPSPSASPAAKGQAPQFTLPDADLAAAGLTAAKSAVTPVDEVVTAGGQTVRLVAGYADPTRIVLVFRTLPDVGAPQVQVSDDKGPIKATYFGARGVVGDQIVGLQHGPNVAAGSVAHLSVTVTGFSQKVVSSGADRVSWTFSATLPVQSASPLSLTPALTSLGTWKVNVEAFELTPSVVHFRALINGAAQSDINDSTAVLVGPEGSPVKPMTIETVDAGPNQTRLDETWIRPAQAAADQLRVSGGGGQYVANIAIPAPPPFGLGKYGEPPPSLLRFPSASQSLDLQGVMNDHISTGRPQSCGAGSGSDNIMLYVFATYFQSNGAWYYVSFMTDRAVQPYHGPGTYTAQASLSAVPTGPEFKGTAQFTVTSAPAFKLHTGRVSGSLGWTDDPRQKVSISGTWSCVWSQESGPA